MEDLTGKQLGPYQVVAPLGEGGMAAVYKAFQPGVERHVALKILPRHYAGDPEFVGRFQQEARIVAQLQHPHILPVFDYGQADGYTYIVMPFLQNGDLTDLLKGVPLAWPQVRRIISQVGDALDYAHQRGLVHRDVKPSNVLLDERGNCLLSDFGITKIVEGTAKFTVTGGIIGTPDYMSPEQGQGKKLDGRSDVYSLGIMLYQMITGRVPYRADTPLAVLVKHVTDPLPPPSQLNPDIPEAVEKIVLKALAKQPDERYPTAGAMVRAVQIAVPETLPGEPAGTIASDADKTVKSAAGTTARPGAATTTAVSEPRASISVKPTWIIAGAVVVLLVVMVGTAAFWLGGDTPQTDGAGAAAVSTSPTPTSRTDLLTAAPIRVVTNTPRPFTPTAPPAATAGFTDTPLSSGPAAATAVNATADNGAAPTSPADPTATTALPTATPALLGQNCSRAPADEFAALWRRYRASLGCPIGDMRLIPTIAEEEFQGGHLFWRSDTDVVYVIYDRSKQSGADLQLGQWLSNPAWKWDGSNPDGVGLSPPPGLVEPKRGFGWLWRTHLGGADGPLGWALDKEYGFDNTGRVQPFEQGIIFRGSSPKTYILLANGEFYTQ